jgi:RNA polymerase sigma-70 factor (ECF subfamily)
VTVNDQEWLAERFEEHRSHLRAVAYRMLGSLSEADDAVQDAWLRLSRTDTSDVENLGGWLTTVVARVSLNMLRARQSRREEPIDVVMPEPIIDSTAGTDPEHEALLADSVGLALLVVLETLTPAERLAFVLHDMFGVPFDQIAPIVERSPQAARQLASRARRRVQGEKTLPDADLDRQREVVDAFVAAAREGDFDALVAVLDPDVVVRADVGALPVNVAGEVRGAVAVTSQAILFSGLGVEVRPALINGVAGAVSTRNGKPFSVGAFTIRGGKVVAIDILADPARVSRLDLTVLDDLFRPGRTSRARAGSAASFGGERYEREPTMPPTTARYDGHADWYDAWNRPNAERNAPEVLELLGPGSGLCLDLGCGSGHYFGILNATGRTVVGVDRSADQLRIARRRSRQLVQADAAALPFGDGAFPAVAMLWISTDVDDFTAVLTEAARVLAPGGRVVVYGAHPCFNGPHVQWLDDGGIIVHPTYRLAGWHQAAPWWGAYVRRRVGMRQHPLAELLNAFVGVGLVIEHVAEPGDRPVPNNLAIRAHKPSTGPGQQARSAG